TLVMHMKKQIRHTVNSASKYGSTVEKFFLLKLTTSKGGNGQRLLPKRGKYRRQHRPDTRGRPKGGTEVSFGEYGLQATTTSWITSRQIEAARIAMTRYMKRGGKVWINIFPHTPYTKKPLEVRMGSGKGAVEGWIAVVKPGRVMS